MDINEPKQQAEFNFSAEQNLTPAFEQSAILAQFTEKTERKLKLRWILAISCLPLFGIYTAFGIAPQNISGNIPISTVVEEIALPESINADTHVAEEHFWYKEHVRRDETLNHILSRLNVQNREAVNFIRNDATASEIVSALKPGRNMEAETDSDGNLISLEYQLNAEQFIHINQTVTGYKASKVTHPLDNRPILKSAKIKNSLFGATDDANIPDDVAIKVAEIFESQIDFNTDLRRGDHFNVIYEGSYDQGELVKTGEVLAVEFVNKGKTFQAIGFRDDANEMQYYTPEGISLSKTFLRTPLEFTRISSNFSLGRFHPILNRIKAHQGTDFAAPMGTGVKAAGDAVVDFVGVKGGYGNVIVLKHENNVSTLYGHLSRFASGLRKGQKVKQAEIVGYVGTTGMSTGPHLHYEFLVGKEHRDPMTVALPKDNTLSEQDKIAFATLSKQLSAQMALLSNSNIAALE